jgi:hypothetical protein
MSQWYHATVESTKTQDSGTPRENHTCLIIDARSGQEYLVGVELLDHAVILDELEQQ